MPEIKKITIEGFVSIIDKLKYKFNRPGLNVISGNNGAGKTTIFNALAYGLFGQTLKPKSSVLPWPKVIEHSNYRGLHITVEVDEYTIHRCIEYKGKVLGKKGGNRLVIEKEGKEVQNLRGKVDAQRFINEYIGYTFQLFKTSILFAQELNSLLEDDGPTKKKTFDEAFASAFINKARDTADKKLKTLQDEQKEIQGNYNNCETLKQKLKGVLQQLEEANRTFATEKAQSIAKLRREISAEKVVRQDYGKRKKLLLERRDLNNKRKGYNNRLDELHGTVNPNLRNDEFQLMLDVTRYSEELEKIKAKQSGVKNSKDARCGECGSKLRGEKLVAHKKHKARKFTELKNQERDLEKSLIYARNRHEAAKKQLSEQSELILELDTIKANLELIEDETKHVKKKLNLIEISNTKINGIKKTISHIRKNTKKNDTSKVEQDIKELGQKMVELTSKGNEVEKKVNLQSWLIKDPLSNSGLKAYIFDSMLRKVNHYLKHYKQYIGFDVTVGINLESANKDFEVVIHKYDDEVPYPDLSKGQKQLTKAVLCFAMNKTLQGSKPLNIMLMDELFETLDPENVEIIGHIIQNEAKLKSIHLITHHTGFNPQDCYKIFIAQNAKGQTVIEQKYRAA